MLAVSDLISHRFRGFGEEENTIGSMRGALDWGVEIVEFDVRMAKCGTPMVYHDEHAPAKTAMRYLSRVMARDFDAQGGRFRSMPTLDDLLQSAADHPNPARLLVDVKDAGFEEAIVALVRYHRLQDRVVYVSWLPEVLYAVSDLEPEAALCFSHWASSPTMGARATHTVLTSRDGRVERPTPTPFGTRSGWWLRQMLTGGLADRIARNGGYVCVPAKDVSHNLVAAYHAIGIGVSAFSYVDIGPAAAARDETGLDLLFSDSKRLFEQVQRSGTEVSSAIGASPSRPGMA